jgi:hypothetical protein
MGYLEIVLAQLNAGSEADSDLGKELGDYLKKLIHTLQSKFSDNAIRQNFQAGDQKVAAYASELLRLLERTTSRMNYLIAKDVNFII